ncbi:hypothetical protein AAY473_005829 [Plecturocebus cupreus]
MSAFVRSALCPTCGTHLTGACGMNACLNDRELAKCEGSTYFRLKSPLLTLCFGAGTPQLSPLGALGGRGPGMAVPVQEGQELSLESQDHSGPEQSTHAGLSRPRCSEKGIPSRRHLRLRSVTLTLSLCQLTRKVILAQDSSAKHLPLCGGFGHVSDVHSGAQSGAVIGKLGSLPPRGVQRLRERWLFIACTGDCAASPSLEGGVLCSSPPARRNLLREKRSSNPENLKRFDAFKIESCSFTQAAVQWLDLTHCNLYLPGSSNSPASTSQVIGIADVHHQARLSFVFLVEMGFRHVGLGLLTSGPPTLASQSVGITGMSHHAQTSDSLLKNHQMLFYHKLPALTYFFPQKMIKE